MTDKLQLAKQNVEAFGKGDWASFKAPLSADAVYEELATQRRTQGPDAIVEISKGWRQAFPDAKGTITKAVESGDTVVLEIIWEGTHNGELKSAMGSIPATYKRVKIPAVQVVTFKGDKIAETKHYFDLMTILAQIGALPVPATA
ncbi:MAG: ester cyclase [Chloroflexi bacterium]|nr:MAG: ester cyclase [Chloroflexota bacterium]